MPLGIIDMVCKLVIMNLSDRFRDRTAFGAFAMCLPFAGGMIMLLGPQTNKGVLLFGCKSFSGQSSPVKMLISL
jgi:ACS family allantoate permease-like MFS transporter